MDSSLNRESTPPVSQGILSSLITEERPITVDEACAIRLLLFGNTANSFPNQWIEQGLKFRAHPPYGMLQKYAGPCGVIAAVQAFVLYELLFGFSRTVLDNGLLRPNVAERKEALSRALSNILWQAGQQKSVIVAKKCDNAVLNESTLSGILVGDGILEYVKLKYFESCDSLVEHIYNFIQNFMKEEGCILFLYSVILTHGIDKIKEEMDYPDSHLIGNDGYCSQEIVNLILIGKAVSNVFNGDVELNSGGEETSVHRGIPKRSKVGLLSLYEYQNTVTVGSFYKDPEYPIWVLAAESHYSVLFGTSRNIFKNPSDFKLFYIDTLVKKNEEVTLTVNPKVKLELENDERTAETEKEKNLPVVIRCIYTRPLQILFLLQITE